MKPDQARAQAIAQFALAGGGEAARRGVPPRRCRPSALTEVGDAVEEEALAQDRGQPAKASRPLLLAQLRKASWPALPPILNPSQANPTPEAGGA
jgi:hypothetical protein